MLDLSFLNDQFYYQNMDENIDESIDFQMKCSTIINKN